MPSRSDGIIASLIQGLIARRSRAWAEPVIVLVAVGLAFQTGKLTLYAALFAYGILLPLLGLLILIKPHLGLFALPVIFFIIPYDWRIPGVKFTSGGTITAGAALVALAGSIATYRSKLLLSPVLKPLIFAALITWVNLLRHGEGFFNVPLIFSESVLLFALAHHLIRERSHVRWFLFFLILMHSYRNVLDIAVSVQSLLAGMPGSVIAGDRLIYGGTSTTLSTIRNLMLPILMVLTIAAQGLPIRMFLGGSVVLNVTWLALASKRTAMVGVVLVPLSLMALVPARSRRRLLILLTPLAILFVLIMGVWTQSFDPMLLRITRDIEEFQMGTGGRLGMWIGALQAFLSSPLIGSGPGSAHSYLLQAARSMGLVFLIPFFLALWRVWRHGAWLRQQELDPMIQAFVVGMQAILLTAVPLNIIGTDWQAAGYGFIFWLLVGVQEAIYDDVREGRYAIANPSEAPPVLKDSPVSRGALSASSKRI